MNNKKRENQPKKCKRKLSVHQRNETANSLPQILDCSRSLFHDYRMLGHLFNDIVALEQKRVQEKERELDELKKFYINLRMEEAEIKRTRWCTLCGMEATYISSDLRNFYCTTKCEQQLLQMVQDEVKSQVNMSPP